MENYDENLKKRQENHLKQVDSLRKTTIPCCHDNCGSCHGTGVKLDGSRCVHMLSCPCPKCTPYCMSINPNQFFTGDKTWLSTNTKE